MLIDLLESSKAIGLCPMGTYEKANFMSVQINIKLVSKSSIVQVLPIQHQI